MISAPATPNANELLRTLPSALAAASDRDVLRVAATAVSSLFPSLGYVRVLLLSQNYSPSQVFELCSDPRMGPLVAEACSTGTQHNSSGSSASGSTAAAAAGTSSAGGGGRAALSVHDTSQQAAMRQGLAVFTPQLQQPQEGQEGGPTDYTDWRVLQQQFGLHSFAAVPLMVAGTVHGVIMAGASAPHTFTQSSMHLLRAVANMLAPYAAVLFKYQQIQSTRSMLEQLLPPRVVAAAIDRLSAGGNSMVDVFVPTHHEFAPEGL